MEYERFFGSITNRITVQPGPIIKVNNVDSSNSKQYVFRNSDLISKLLKEIVTISFLKHIGNIQQLEDCRLKKICIRK